MVENAQRFKFSPEWRTTLFVGLMVPLMVGLGFWQLQRAEEKAALALAFEAQRQRPAVELASLAGAPAEQLAYLPVRMRGSFRIGEYFLLDNSIRGGRFGNEVVAVFDLSGGGQVLVNRGWVPADPARLSAPVVSGVAGTVTVTGHIYVAPGDAYLLAAQELQPGWPKTVQALEMEALGAAVDTSGGTLFPYPVRIDEGQPGALLTDWLVINISPEKHTAYAVQWFAMAAVLAVFYILRTTNIAQLAGLAKRL